MKKIYLLFLPLLAILPVLIAGCENDYPGSIYNPDDKGNPTPMVTSVSPANVAYAVADEVTINGQNFSSIKDDNYVYFGKYKVPVTSATTTQLKVMAPNIQSDSLGIKVAVKGAQLYSNPLIKYKLLPAFIEFGGYTKLDDPYGVEGDLNGNLYVALSLGVKGKIEKITPEGVKSDYGAFTFGVANSLKFGPDGGLYLTRLIPLIYKIPAGGGDASVYVTLPGGGKAGDIDFDKDGNMWVVGNNQFVYKVKTDKSVKSYALVANAKAVRVYNDYVYVSGKDATGKETIWRAQIQSNDLLGAFEVYFDWASKYSSNTTSLAFSGDGILYVGTDGADAEAIIAIKSDKSASSLYPGFLLQKSYYLSWGGGVSSKYLFVSRRNENPDLRKIIKIYMGKEGAPYLGRK